MPRQEYRPRPSKDARPDCVRAGWRTTEDITPEGVEISPEDLSEVIVKVQNNVAMDELAGIYAKVFGKVIFDVDNTPDGELLFLSQTVGMHGNTVLYFANKDSI